MPGNTYKLQRSKYKNKIDEKKKIVKRERKEINK